MTTEVILPEQKLTTSPSPQNSTPRLVLFWSPKYGSLETEAWGEGKLVEIMAACPFKCEFTVDKSYLTYADAVVYHGWPEGEQIYQDHLMYPLPEPLQGRWDQVWVFFTTEPPCFFSDKFEQLNDQYEFNWTFTYRRDSDVQVLYGDFEKIPTEPIEHRPIDSKDTRKLLAGMISNCKKPSGRDDYIRELRRFMAVDICGECGNPGCSFPRRPFTEKPFEMLGKQYKFWAAFENSLTLDYVTEKFFLPLQYGMVPVYFGHPDNLRHFPPGSYIHTKDFKNPQALSEHLMYLDKNPSEYLKFVEWRKKYRLITYAESHSSMAWCGFCTKLHKRAPGERKTYPSVREWFLRNNTNTSVCLKPWNTDRNTGYGL